MFDAVLRSLSWRDIPNFVVGLILTYCLCVRYATPLRKIPGPVLLSCWKLPRLIALWRGNVSQWDMSMHRKYGSVVRIGPQLVQVSNPDEIEGIYGTKANFIKSPFYMSFSSHDAEGLIPDPFVLSDKAMHSRMRRSAANAYAASIVPMYEKNVDGVISRFINDTRKKNLDKPCDLGILIRNFIADSIYNLNFDSDLNFVEEGDKDDILHRIEKFMHIAATIGTWPWLYKFVLGNTWSFEKLIGKHNPFMPGFMITFNSFAALKADPSTAEPRDGSTTFIARTFLNQQAKPETLTDRELITHAYGNTAAGVDTTATAVRGLFYYLLKNPNVYDKLCDEIRSASLSKPVTFQATSRLPYLGAVIKESIRIHPPVGMMLPRLVPEGGTTVGGYYLPAGTEVGISPWVVHRDPKVFPDPEKFDPERWLTKDQDLLLRMNRAFFAFGAGPRTCSGRYISAMQSQKFIASILLEFELQSEDPKKEWTFASRFFTPQTGIKAIITARK